jgi:hypothetical protein
MLSTGMFFLHILIVGSNFSEDLAASMFLAEEYKVFAMFFDESIKM